MTLSEIKTATNGLISPHDATTDIRSLAIDSRKITDAKYSLFVALVGDFRDGHDFIEDAYRQGVRHFLVSKISEKYSKLSDAVFVTVPDTRMALQQIAIAHRHHFQLPVIGITGSNGKTIVKEWLFQLLAKNKTIVRNPKSYNSQIGVPLSVWQINATHDLGLFEAGISKPNEMAALEKIIQPTWGLFTNIGDAHSEGFTDIQQKIDEKLLLFQHVKKLFFCSDHKAIYDRILQFKEKAEKHLGQVIELCYWSQKEEAPLRVFAIEKKRNKAILLAEYEGRKISILIPFGDDASIENAIHCWNILLHLNIPDEQIRERMVALHPVAMRLEMISAINHSLLINDTYNSDIASLRIALDTLSQQKRYTRQTLILSDFQQVGLTGEKRYQKIADWIVQKKINRFIGIGEDICCYKNCFTGQQQLQSSFYPTTEVFLDHFQELNFDNEAILLKGARRFKFERIVHLLGQKIHKTIFEINLSAVGNNLKVYKSLLPPKVKMMAMVKAASYGSGSYEIAEAVQEAGADYLGVAYVDEGVALRRAGIGLPIMVINPESGSYDRMVFWHLEPEIYSLESLQQVARIVTKNNKNNYPIHIELDTGMCRLGFVDKDLETLKESLKNNPQLHVVSIFSHLSASEEPQFDAFTRRQAAHFQKMAEDISAVLPRKPLFHLLNSTGITRHRDFHFDMVRLGLGLYGIDGSGIVQRQLLPIGTLKTTIAQTHQIASGSYVGYDLKGQVVRDSRIATVNIGYADGYSRDFGNGKSYMMVHGKKATVVGAVCMDMCMLDVTDIPEAQAGDEVIVFGQEPDLNQLAEWTGTIPYEIMTSISQRVNRVYVRDE